MGISRLINIIFFISIGFGIYNLFKADILIINDQMISLNINKLHAITDLSNSFKDSILALLKK